LALAELAMGTIAPWQLRIPAQALLCRDYMANQEKAGGSSMSYQHIEVIPLTPTG
jgi:hypothetical protein